MLAWERGKGQEGWKVPLPEEKETLVYIIFVLIQTLHRISICLPALNPTADELQFPIFGIWGEPGLM